VFVPRGRPFATEIIDEVLALCGTGLSTHEVARRTQVNQSTVARWARGDLPNRSRGGPSCPHCGGLRHAASLADDYAYLFGLYLGDGCLGRHGTNLSLRLTLDTAYPGIIEEARGSIASVVARQRSSVYAHRDMACVTISAYNRHWACLFPQHGAGPKHRRPIILADWQAEIVREHPGRFLRGLIHSDGWRGLNRVRVKGRDYAYPRYQFSNRSDDIRRLFTDTCDLMGIAWRPWGRWHISVARRDAVALLDEHVGPKS
jgi:hypothetical protein